MTEPTNQTETPVDPDAAERALAEQQAQAIAGEGAPAGDPPAPDAPDIAAAKKAAKIEKAAAAKAEKAAAAAAATPSTPKSEKQPEAAPEPEFVVFKTTAKHSVPFDILVAGESIQGQWSRDAGSVSFFVPAPLVERFKKHHHFVVGNLAESKE